MGDAEGKERIAALFNTSIDKVVNFDGDFPKEGIRNKPIRNSPSSSAMYHNKNTTGFTTSIFVLFYLRCSLVTATTQEAILTKPSPKPSRLAPICKAVFPLWFSNSRQPGRAWRQNTIEAALSQKIYYRN